MSIVEVAKPQRSEIRQKISTMEKHLMNLQSDNKKYTKRSAKLNEASLPASRSTICRQSKLNGQNDEVPEQSAGATVVQIHHVDINEDSDAAGGDGSSMCPGLIGAAPSMAIIGRFVVVPYIGDQNNYTY